MTTNNSEESLKSITRFETLPGHENIGTTVIDPQKLADYLSEQDKRIEKLEWNNLTPEQKQDKLYREGKYNPTSSIDRGELIKGKLTKEEVREINKSWDDAEKDGELLRWNCEKSIWEKPDKTEECKHEWRFSKDGHIRACNKCSIAEPTTLTDLEPHKECNHEWITTTESETQSCIKCHKTELSEPHKEDWIIKGVNGEFYPCKPDIFEKTYELVEG